MSQSGANVKVVAVVPLVGDIVNHAAGAPDGGFTYAVAVTVPVLVDELTLFVAVVVLLGHIHYSIDVLSAFFITYGIFHICKFLFKREWKFFSETQNEVL